MISSGAVSGGVLMSSTVSFVIGCNVGTGLQGVVLVEFLNKFVSMHEVCDHSPLEFLITTFEPTH